VCACQTLCISSKVEMVPGEYHWQLQMEIQLACQTCNWALLARPGQITNLDFGFMLDYLDHHVWVSTNI
jgi:hypothetical protein